MGLVTFLLMLFPPPVMAHLLDEFYQSTFITLAPNRIMMQVELYTGVLVAPQVLAIIDTDRNDRLGGRCQATS